VIVRGGGSRAVSVEDSASMSLCPLTCCTNPAGATLANWDVDTLVSLTCDALPGSNLLAGLEITTPPLRPSNRVTRERCRVGPPTWSQGIQKL